MTRRPRSPLPALVLALVLALQLAACGSPPAATPPAATSPVGAPPATYVSVGDSYAAGFQPAEFADDAGFAAQVARRLAGTPQALELVQLGCPGATTASVVQDLGCPHPYGPDVLAHPGTTQLAALEQVLAARAGRVRLVTVVLGGNDVLPCLALDDAVGCVRAALPGLTARLATVLAAVRRLAPRATVVGLGYPDVLLGLLATGSGDDAGRARASVALFRDLLGPALERTYAAAGAVFVDVAARSGAYDPLTPAGTVLGRAVPASVVTLCRTTHVCTSGDIHPDEEGYSWYADRVLESLRDPTSPTSPAPGGAP